MRLRGRLVSLRRRQAGYSLVELLVVMATLGIILTGVTTVFVQGSRAELNTNRRFQAQLQATAAFDRLRRDIHCASSATISGATMTLTGCGSGDISWCTVASGSWFTLYRKAGSSCDSTGKLYAESLTSSSLFTYTAPVADTSLAKVRVVITANANTTSSTSVDAFQLADDIVLRNSLRG